VTDPRRKKKGKIIEEGDEKKLSQQHEQPLSKELPQNAVKEAGKDLQIEFTKLSFWERSVRRRWFWEENELFDFAIIWTQQLRIRNPDLDMLRRKLRTLKGEGALVEEYLSLLLVEARDYNKIQLISVVKCK